MSAKFHRDVQEDLGAIGSATHRLLTRIRTKKVSWTTFHLLNGDRQPVVGDKYLIARSTGAIEPWMLLHIDQPNCILMFVCC